MAQCVDVVGAREYGGVSALNSGKYRGKRRKLTIPNGMARETGLEPATSAVTGQRSNQLSYSRVDRLKSRSEAGHKGGTI
jgi:hypothetical protein